MSTFLMLCVGLAAGFLVSLALLAKFDKVYNKSKTAIAGWVLFWFCGVSLFGCGVIAVVVYPSRSVGNTTCRHWGEQSGYETKFRILNWADTGTCLARTPNGRWVKNTNIIINVPEKP